MARTPLFPAFPHLLHGGDWNPDQWLHAPEVIDEDFRLFPVAGANCVSLAIFAWAALEPAEGRYAWDWLDRILDRLHAQGMRFLLATPSGARPVWLAAKHPEVCRTDREGRLQPVQGRHNHCPTAPSYRAHVARINGELARRYGAHPGLLGWHISNELNGECFCPTCLATWRAWLARRYGTIEALNRAWWSAFWSHTFPSFAHVGLPDASVDGMVVDWKRCVSDQTVDWVRHETAALRAGGSTAPTTTNLMGFFPNLDYHRLAESIDFVSWDSYPSWGGHAEGEAAIAADTACAHDLMRCLKPERDGHQPFVLMESSPSAVNWKPVSRLKRPGMHRLASLQAVAHGSDAVCYFQWRKGRGGCEKHHGAVVDHAGTDTRVFREVAELGGELAALDRVVGTRVRARIAIIYDWQVRWAIEASALGNNQDKRYVETILAHYRPLWQAGYDLDVVSAEHPLDDYRLVVAPMLHQLRPGVAARLAAFVERGGTLLSGYLSGWCDRDGLCLPGGWPGDGLRQLFGVRDEETDAPAAHVRQRLRFAEDNPLGLSGEHAVADYAALLHPEGATVAATYAADWYAGRPALTVACRGDGEAWYCAARLDAAGLVALLPTLARRAGVDAVLPAPPPAGVSVRTRGSGEDRVLFVMNFADEPRRVQVGSGLRRLADGAPCPATLDLPPLGCAVLA